MRRMTAVVAAAAMGAAAVGAGMRGKAERGMARIEVEAVEYEHAGVTYRGFRAYDAAIDSVRPGVLVCHEWWGCNDYAKERARKLAEMGYVAFALDVYGKGRITTDPGQASQWAGALYANAERVAIASAGLGVLASDPRVDRTRMAAIGYCMGGTVALDLARSGADLDAVVTFHTSTIAAGEGSSNEAIGGTVLVCHGALDTFVSDEQIKGFREQMEAAKKDYVFISYAGAVHSFTNPGADAFKIPGVAYHAKADARSWADMRQVFDEVWE